MYVIEVSRTDNEIISAIFTDGSPEAGTVELRGNLITPEDACAAAALAFQNGAGLTESSVGQAEKALAGFHCLAAAAAMLARGRSILQDPADLNASAAAASQMPAVLQDWMIARLDDCRPAFLFNLPAWRVPSGSMNAADWRVLQEGLILASIALSCRIETAARRGADAATSYRAGEA